MASFEMTLRREPLDPLERLKLITNFSSSIEVDPHIPPTRYYRSGVEMVRMANVYQQEGNLENALMLYMKYMTLFLEKIRKHPDFSSVPLNMRSANQQTLRTVIPKAEALKQVLLEQYQQEFQEYKIIKAKEEEEERRLKEEQERRLKEEQERKQHLEEEKQKALAGHGTTWGTTVIMPPRNIDSISYPESAYVPTDRSMTVTDVTEDAPKKPVTPCPSLGVKKSMIVAPAVDRGSKPSTTSPTVLRTVVIPSCLSARFLMLAGQNTLNNIETCGILAGILEHNQLIITHLIVPKQKGSPDSCTTMNEEEIFDLQDQFGLITIGWIHTHPTQTAFLSSVDLHTHCPYQLLMPEAVAIVCAPKYNDTGIFILTPSHGLGFISNCRSTGFHPHPTDPPLFMPAAHIKYDPRAGIEVIDLRGKKIVCG